MTVLLDLTAEQEEKLRQAALMRGLDTSRLLREVVDAALAALVPPASAQSRTAPPAHRTADLHSGQTWISEDFDAPLPDGFWLGEE